MNTHNLYIETVETPGGKTAFVPLLQKGDSLPKEGRLTLCTGETVFRGENTSINLKIWEGDAPQNRFVGILKIMGTDISSTLPAGTPLDFTYEIPAWGTLYAEVTVPHLTESFCMRTVWEDADIDRVADEAKYVLASLEYMPPSITAGLADAKKAAQAVADGDAKSLRLAKAKIQVAKKRHLAALRQWELQSCVDFFENMAVQYAAPHEQAEFETLRAAAEKATENQDAPFENILEDMRNLEAVILLRQDWFVKGWYRHLCAAPKAFGDAVQFEKLKQLGDAALRNNKMDALRQILFDLLVLAPCEEDADGMFATPNIVCPLYIRCCREDMHARAM